MRSLFHSFAAAAVVTSVAAGLSAGSRSLPKGPLRDAAEKFASAPGRAVLDKLQQSSVVQQAEKKAEKEAEKAAEKAADKAAAKVEKEIGVDAHVASVGTWAGAGFALCWLAVLALGVSSLKSALALGFKVTLFMIALQAALLFTGVLAWQSIKV
jgi:hypothetical protein